MSNTGDGRNDEIRDRAEDAGAESPDGRLDQVTDASPAAPAASRAESNGDTAALDDASAENASGGQVAVPAAAPAESTTTPPAAPGPVGPGDTAVIPPEVVRSTGAPTRVEPPVGSDRTAGVETDDDVPPYVPGEPYPGTEDDRATNAEPGAPVDEEPADARSRLDAAVQRATAVPVASDGDADQTPEPVAADSVRRETYVPPAAGGAAVGAATLASEPQAPQTVYVQAPTPPKKKSNRGFGLLVALLGAAVFAALYAGVAYLMFLGQAGGDATELFVQFLSRPIYWVPVIATFVGFALLVVIVNRGPWWMYAVFGLLVGVLVYFSYIGAALLTVNAWELTPQQAVDFINSRWLDPLAIAAGVIAREIPIWFGGWIAKRGRGVAERNRLAMEAYDRELAAGPRPVAR